MNLRVPESSAAPPARRAAGRAASSALAALLALGASGSALAYANPNPTPITPIPPQTIPRFDELVTPVTLTGYSAAQCAAKPPSSANCVDQVWVTSCGAGYGATDHNSTSNPCWQLAHDALKAWGDAQPKNGKAKIYDPVADDFAPAFPNVNQMGSVARKKTDTQNTWAVQEEKAKVAAANNFFIGWFIQPQDFQRYSTAQNVPMNTCEQYVYRRYYELERWIDAMNACKNDARCVTRMSMWGLGPKSPSKVPGILRRELLDSESHPINDHIGDLMGKGKLFTYEGDAFDARWTLPEDMPKNGYYASSELWVTQSLIDGLKPPEATVDCAADPQAPSCVVQAMLNELHRGSKLYRLADDVPVISGVPYYDAKGNARRGFWDEANFHWAMDKKTANVSDGEFREYRRRTSAFLAQLDLLADETKCMSIQAQFPGQACGRHIPNAIGKTNPGDTQMWQGDPMASRGIFGNVTADQWVATPAFQGQVGVGSNLQTSGLDLGTIVSGNLAGGIDLIGGGMHVPGMVQLGAVHALSHTVGGNGGGSSITPMAAVVGPPGQIPGPPGVNIDGPAPLFNAMTGQTAFNLKGVIASLWMVNKPRIDHTADHLRLDCKVPTRIVPRDGNLEAIILPGNGLNVDDKFHTERVWKDVCDLTNMLLDEWNRYQQGKGSCLDPKNFGCDWMPQDFVDRFVTQNVGYAGAAKEWDYRECRRFTGGGDLLNGNTAWSTGIGLTSNERRSLPLFQGALLARDDHWTQVMKNVPVKAQDDFGTVRTEEHHLGDGDFGGGYSYTLGWHLKVFERYSEAAAAKDPNPPDDPQHKYGWPCRVGGDMQAKFKAGATLFGSDFNILDANGLISSNAKDDAKAWVNAKLYVVGYDVFDTRDLDGASPNGDFDLTYALHKLYGDEEKPQLIEAPFQVGPVTVTVSAGIAYDYGVKIDLAVGSAPKGSCSVTAVIFGASATFTPFADLGVWVDADASIAGGLVGVGVEVDLTLVGLQLPFNVQLALALENDTIGIAFDARLDLVLTTLKGELDFYIKGFWIKLASFTIVKWDGYSHKFPIFKTPHTLLPLAILPAGTISPPPVGTGGDPQSM